MARYTRRRSSRSRRTSRSGSYRRTYRTRSRRRVSRRTRPQTVRVVIQTAAASPASLGQSQVVPIRSMF